MFTVAVFCCLLVNLGSILLTAIVRKRSRHFLDEDAPTVAVQDLTLNPVPTISSHGHERQGAELKRTTTEAKISSANMRLLATQKHTVLGAKAQQLLVYRKAERDLLLVSSALPSPRASPAEFEHGELRSLPLAVADADSDYR